MTTLSDGGTTIIPGEGYNPDSVYYGGAGSIPGGSGEQWGGEDEGQECEWPYVKKGRTYTEITTVPGRPCSPGQPYIGPTASQVSLNNNEGWNNSCSSSVDPVNTGQQISFKVYHDSRGFFLGLAHAGSELQYIGLYSIGLIFDQGGAYVYESGQRLGMLKSSLQPGDSFAIRRYADGSIVYISGDVIIKSGNTIEPIDTVFAYGIGYQAGDMVLEAAIDNFTEIGYPDDFIEFDQVGTAYVTNSEYVEFDQVGAMTVDGDPVGFGQVGYTLCRNQFNSIGDLDLDITVPVFHADDSEDGYSSLDLDITVPVFSAGDEYIPPQLNVLDLLIGPVVIDMDGVRVRTGDLDMDITVPVFHAEEENYSSLDMDITAPVFSAYQSPPGYMLLYNDLMVSDSNTIMKDVVIPLYMGLVATDNLQMFKDILMVMSMGLTVSDDHQIFADKQIAINEVCTFLDSMRFSVDDLPDHSGGVAWVMNIASGATSLFLDYGFNSFMNVDGIACGITDGGIYKLQETSAVVPSSGIDYGLSNFGSPRKKRIPHFYAAVASTGKVYLRLLADGVEVEYFALSFSDYVEPNKINVGRGLFAVYWNPMIIAPDGVSIEELDALEWAPMTFNRRV